MTPRRGKSKIAALTSSFVLLVSSPESGLTSDTQDGVKNVTKQKWSIHHPPINNLPIVITAEVYFTIKPDISEHEPLCVKGTATVRDCFTKFCDVQKIISDPAAANIRQIRQKDGEVTWEIVSCVVIKHSADSIKLGIHIRDEAELLGMYDGKDGHH